MTPARQALAAHVAAFHLPDDEIRALQRMVHDGLLAGAHHIFEPNFTSLHTRDLELLFDLYDRHFFAGLLRPALGADPITFRGAPRLTKAGGKTTQRVHRNGATHYEIAIAVAMLFDGFRADDPAVTVSGIVCSTRLEAMQRIFEHELVHLYEMLCVGRSKCAAAPFQAVARRLFLHSAHTHRLVTRRERAAGIGIRVGTRVAFTMEGKRYTGRVNRVTKRATVLVENPNGRLFSDGKRYLGYYVPIGALQPVESEPTR